MSFTVEIAGFPFKIINKYEYIEQLCRDYISDDKELFSISATDSEILSEQQQSDNLYGPDTCEAICILRKTANQLIRYGVILIHSAVVSVDDEAYVFAAKSGVGKSTHINLWLKSFGKRAVVVNGDKPFFSFKDGILLAHGSPWRGKENQGQHISVPVKGICLLERGEINSIEKADGKEIIAQMFRQVLLPDSKTDQAEFFGILNRIIASVPFYKLKCNTEPQAALVAYNAMNGESV